MQFTIGNKAEVDRWINMQLKKGRSLSAIKGAAPEGATYSDGTIIKNPVNIGWRVNETGEKINILYC